MTVILKIMNSVQNNNRLVRENQWRKNAQLFSAIRNFKSCDRVHELLQLGVDPDVRFQGVPAITEAVKVGSLQIVREFLNFGASHAQTDNDGATPLHYCCSKSQILIAELLIHAGANINASDNNRMTLLHNAVQHMNLHLIKIMLERGVALNRRTIFGQTALHFAAQNSNIETLRLLITAGAELDPIDSEDATPLWLALKSGHLETIKLLIKSGARLDLPQQTFTPLDWSIHSENDIITEMILRHTFRHTNHTKALCNLLEQKKFKLSFLLIAALPSFHNLLELIRQNYENLCFTEDLQSTVPSLMHLSRIALRKNAKHNAERIFGNISKNYIPLSLASYVSLEF